MAFTHVHITLQHLGVTDDQAILFDRLASRVFAAAPQRGGSREEGSVLGGFGAGGLLGGVLGGDDD